MERLHIARIYFRLILPLQTMSSGWTSKAAPQSSLRQIFPMAFSSSRPCPGCFLCLWETLLFKTNSRAKARNRHISTLGAFASFRMSNAMWIFPGKGSRTVEENPKVVLPISFIKADAKAHLSNADNRILQSAIIRIFIFTVKNQM